MDRVIKKNKWTLKRMLTAGVSGLFILFILVKLIFGDHSSKLNVNTERVTISEVTRGPFQEFIPVNGNVIPLHTRFLDAEEGGQLDTIYIEAGELVKKGDRILRLSNTNLLLDILYREADLAEQSNALRNTRLEMERNRLDLQSQLIELNYDIKKQKRLYQRMSTLHNKDLVSLEEFEAARDDYEYMVQKRDLTVESHVQDSLFRASQIHNLESSLSRMQNSLELVKKNLENLTLRAPLTGQLTSLIPEVGESIARGERIGQIDVLDGFKVRVSIDQHYIARINPGQSGEFDFNNQTYRLTIRKIYPEVIDGSFQADMEFEGDEPEGIRRGQTLYIRLELGDLSEATLLARGGFYQKTGGQWVYVVDPSGDFAEKRDIRLGRQNPQVFEVLEGLETGEKVITSGYDTYGDIDKLILKKD